MTPTTPARRTRLRVFVMTALGVAFAGAGCSVDLVSGNLFVCSAESDCLSGYHCVAGACRPDCTGGAACGAGEECRAAATPAGDDVLVCIPPRLVPADVDAGTAGDSDAGERPGDADAGPEAGLPETTEPDADGDGGPVCAAAGESCAAGIPCCGGALVCSEEEQVCCNSECAGPCFSCTADVPGVCLQLDAGTGCINSPIQSPECNTCNAEGQCVVATGTGGRVCGEGAPCMQCNAAGRCMPVTAGQDPFDQCGSHDDCGGSCNGQGSCANFAAAGTSCEPCHGCNDTGDCEPLAPLTADPACGDDDCAGLCTADGQCGTPEVAGTPCGEPCQACDGVGLCVAVTVGATDDRCVTGDCSSTGVCQANARCTPVPDGAPCGVGSTCNETEQTIFRCADEQCTPVDCAPGRCTPADGEGLVACSLGCETDADCFTNAYCDGGQCHVKTPAGRPCPAAERPDWCETGVCADGVCCDRACDGLCEACDLTGSVGFCTLVETGADPDGDCLGTGTCAGTCNGFGGCAFPGFDTTCGGEVECSGRCDGGGACDFPPAGTDCEGTCRACDDVGRCRPVAAGSDPFLECPGGDAGCESLCDGAGACAYPEDVACGVCRQCDGSGRCAAVTGGSDPFDECATQAVSTCGLDGACDGAGACRFYEDGRECAQPGCSSAQLTLYTCQDHSCLPVTARCVGGYACENDHACFSACSSELQCATDYFCEGTSCAADRVAGAPCTYPGQCQDGHCVDGVCCLSACTGRCQRCDLQGLAGQCSPIATGADPDEECTGGLTCGGTCNGAGSCQFPQAGLTCGTCLECNGAGACVFVAVGGDPNEDCPGVGVCNGTCSGAGQCQYAGQGVTCGACRRCDGAGGCAAVAAGEDPFNDCFGEHAVCGGRCDGSGACLFGGAGTSCGLCEACNGSGSCVDVADYSPEPAGSCPRDDMVCVGGSCTLCGNGVVDVADDEVCDPESGIPCTDAAALCPTSDPCAVPIVADCRCALGPPIAAADDGSDQCCPDIGQRHLDPNCLAWTQPFGSGQTPTGFDYTNGQPVAIQPADNTVFVGGVTPLGEPQLYAIDGADGSLLWAQALDAPPTSSPVVHDGWVYVGATQYLTRIRLAAPHDRQQVLTGGLGNIKMPPTVFADDTLLVVTANDRLHKIRVDADATSLVWSFSLPEPTTVATTAASVVGNRAIWGKADGRLWSVDPAPDTVPTGEPLCFNVSDPLTTASPAVGSNYLVVVTRNARVFGLLPSQTGPSCQQIWVDLAVSAESESSPVFDGAGRVVVSLYSTTGQVDRGARAYREVASGNQTPTWTALAGRDVPQAGAMGCLPTTGGGCTPVYYAAVDHGADEIRLFAIDPRPLATERVLWEYDYVNTQCTAGRCRLKSDLSLGPDGHLYFRTADGKVHAIVTESVGLLPGVWAKQHGDYGNTGNRMAP